MSTWIGHLRIAEELLRRIPGLDAAQFAIGSVAPDSGIPEDENRTKFTPPVQVTHFQPAGKNQRDHHDLDFYRSYLRDIDPVADPLRFSFRLGYFFHLVTDNLWSLRVGRPTKERFAKQAETDPDLIYKAKDNWYGLDFLHVRAHPESIFWRVFLDARPFDLAQDRPVAADSIPFGNLDFLPVEALTQQLAYIKEYYQRTDAEIQEMIDMPYIYLTQADMDRFVADTSRDLQTIYNILWNERRDTSNFHTAISFLQLNTES